MRLPRCFLERFQRVGDSNHPSRTTRHLKFLTAEEDIQGEEECWDAQSTEKSVFYGFLSLVSVYGHIFFMAESTDFFLLGSATTPPPLQATTPPPRL